MALSAVISSSIHFCIQVLTGRVNFDPSQTAMKRPAKDTACRMNPLNIPKKRAIPRQTSTMMSNIAITSKSVCSISVGKISKNPYICSFYFDALRKVKHNILNKDEIQGI